MRCDFRLVSRRAALLFTTTLMSGLSGAGVAHAQEDGQNQLNEIVVTAQKREQSLQDVPIAITALTQAQLESNRVTSVNDLSGLAPGLTSRPASGGISIASFSMRGITSYGVVPGSDKEISIYLDGVYLSSSRASIFDLPDIQRIEVLRGPQGTLFGRNATAGAISIVTREPTGNAGARQDFTFGNYDQFRARTTLDLPSWGPFSAYVTYVRDKRRGDIRNLGAGTVWDRSSPDGGRNIQRSPRYLGDKDSDSWFASLKFESGPFKTVYKFDRAVNRGTPEGMAIAAYNPGGAALLLAKSGQPAFVAQHQAEYVDAIVAANLASGNLTINSSNRRPKEVNNSFATDMYQRNTGHSLTSTLEVSDSISFKNVAAYRSSYVEAASQLDGAGGLIVPASAALPFAYLVASAPVASGGFAGFTSLPAATQAIIAAGYAANPAIQAAAGVGNRYVLLATNNRAASKQWSDELQLNYDSDLLTLTVGGIWFHSKDLVGGPEDIRNTFNLTAFPTSGVIPLGNQAVFNNRATSIAAYTQAEIHVTPQIDIVGGARITRDKKSGTNTYGGVFTAAGADRTQGTYTGQSVVGFNYKKTKPNFSIGVNYKPDNNLLVYGKYSTGFVSGGAVPGDPLAGGNITFEPETVKSWEAGVKADLLDRHLRTNLSLWKADYSHLQSTQGGTTVGRPDLSTLIVDAGQQKAKGVELEVTAALLDGLTLGGSGSYTSTKFKNVNPLLLLFSANNEIVPTLTPKWTANLFGEYQTMPLFGDARLTFRADANWRSKMRTDSSPDLDVYLPALANTEFSPASWIVNGRIALRDIDIGAGKTEIALWGRNLTDNKLSTYPSAFPYVFKASSYQPARTYGVDVKFAF